MKKFIIITSIYEPTEAVVAFSKISDWQLVIVGDKKTPENWHLENVIYLSPEKQQKIASNFSEAIPWNHYSRKMIGYIYAMKNGADIIADTDDDNIPKENWGENIEFSHEGVVAQNDDFMNIYKVFTKQKIWPRGYPLRKILNEKPVDFSNEFSNVGIWQQLADGDTDVDAIYRLTNNSEVTFDNKKTIALKEGTICPFNSQNTFFKKELFPLLYLPAFVTFRFTDILRGLVAQPILWNHGYRLGFSSPTVVQKRNEHDYLKDFESEIPMYINTEKANKILQASINKQGSIKENLANAYNELAKNKIVPDEECLLLSEWLRNF